MEAFQSDEDSIFPDQDHFCDRQVKVPAQAELERGTLESLDECVSPGTPPGGELHGTTSEGKETSHQM